eukprot:Opistho-2@74294
MMLAGLKKCVPMTLSGRDVEAAISSTLSVDVFVHSSASFLQIASSFPNTSFFTGIDSNTASITRSAPARLFRSVAVLTSEPSFKAVFSSRRPFFTASSNVLRTVVCDRFSASSFESTTVTGIPACANEIAIPVPIVPDPTIPAVFTSRATFPSRPGTLEHVRSAKKRCCCARAWVCPISHRIRSCSTRIPESNDGDANDARTASTHFRWATISFGRRDVALVARSMAASCAARSPCTTRSAVRRGLSPAVCANSTAFATTQSVSATRRSMIPASIAFFAATGFPPTIMSTANSTPVSRGRRWVPPAPGRIPSSTSGRPTLTLLLAIR